MSQQKDSEILFLREVEDNCNEERGFASSTLIYSGGYFPEFFTSTSEIPSAITETISELGKHDLFYIPLLTFLFAPKRQQIKQCSNNVVS